MSSYQPTDIVTSMAEIRAVVPDEFASQTGKIIDRIDPLVRAWIERSPFVTIGTHNDKGHADVAPKGDPAGFVKVLDEKTLAIPDRPGNHRFDTFENILETGRIALMFLVPNRREVVRVNGSARIVRDLELREAMTINGRVPEFAILVHVEEAFYHCGKAVIRSGLWEPDKAASIEGLPTYAEALIEHAKLQRSLDEMEAILRSNEENRLYDE
ncbi:MAG: pyridoxamine 5'-phosphate oxidase family protein [Rhodobacteraceae bacterium]|nr:pyridoxamine 5'-phosphate oxidase family protein [Paracoccaceae bacterium]